MDMNFKTGVIYGTASNEKVFFCLVFCVVVWLILAHNILGRNSIGDCEIVRRLTAGVLVRAVATVLLAVAEQAALDAVTVAAGKEPVLAQWLVRDQQRLHLALLVLKLAVLYRVLPVAGLI